MDELICRAAQGTASEGEEATLLAWRQASRANERQYREMVWLLRESLVAEESVEVDPPPLLEDLVSPNSFRGSPEFRRRSKDRRLFLRGLVITAAAASLAIVIGRTREAGTPAPAFTFGTGEIVTGKLESSTVRLGDGTVVRLAPESRLRLMGETGRREVWLEGRAYFAVVRDEARPFRLRTHAGDAVVLGTRFDIEATAEDLRVIVVEGAVRLGVRGETVDVEALQLGRVGPSLAPRREDVDEEYIRDELDWVGNFIAFENTPLERAARELSAHYGVPVEVLDSTLARETVWGIFAEESLDEVVAVICRAVTAHCTIGPTRVTIGL